ncbi:transposase family protein [Spinactinospora alkalitolerans]|uniref:transposase family protein n=1 Tax=Spinactinospora alkalitolerans TaxID=687207 RepID=UPI0035E3F667
MRIHARPRAPHARCPTCDNTSERVHSRYRRRLHDTALSGRRAVIDLTIRRFLCTAPACTRRTFAEQVTGLTECLQAGP